MPRVTAYPHIIPDPDPSRASKAYLTLSFSSHLTIADTVANMGKVNEKASGEQRRLVYVQCRPIFSGQNAHQRKVKKITALVEGSKSLQPLLRDIGKDKLLKVLQSLLDKGIFESELQAKVEFPDLFRPSPQREAQRHASELSAARFTAEVLSEISSQDGMERSFAARSGAVNKSAMGLVVSPDAAEHPARLFRPSSYGKDSELLTCGF